MKHGFSLVELSIVLVILGLLTGGILAGQNLIRAAELRSVSTDFGRYTTAANTFRDKYFSFPGDMRNAESFWGTMATGTCPNATGGSGTQTCNGDGDGQIDQGASANQSGEMFMFWKQLANAGLIEGNYTGIAGPSNQQDGVIGVNAPRAKISNAGWYISYNNNPAGTGSDWFAGAQGNIFYFGGELSAGPIAGPALTPEEAWNIDTKMDDGLPAQGGIISWKQGGSVNPNCATTAVEATAEYDLPRTSVECSLTFVRPF